MNGKWHTYIPRLLRASGVRMHMHMHMQAGCAPVHVYMCAPHCCRRKLEEEHKKSMQQAAAVTAAQSSGMYQGEGAGLHAHAHGMLGPSPLEVARRTLKVREDTLTC